MPLRLFLYQDIKVHNKGTKDGHLIVPLQREAKVQFDPFISENVDFQMLLRLCLNLMS